MESDSEDAVVVPRGARRVGAGGARVDSDDEEMALPVARADSGEEGGDADAAPRPAMQRLKRLQTAGAAAAAAEAVRLPEVSHCLAVPGRSDALAQASPRDEAAPAASGETGAGAGADAGADGGGEGEDASEYEESEDEEEALERHVAEKGTLSGAGGDDDGDASGAEGDDGAQGVEAAQEAARSFPSAFPFRALVCPAGRTRRAQRRSRAPPAPGADAPAGTRRAGAAGGLDPELLKRLKAVRLPPTARLMQNPPPL